MKRSEMVTIFLLGALVVFTAIAVFRPRGQTAQAQGAVPTASAGYEYLATNANNGAALFIIDHGRKRFAYYTTRNASSPQDFKLFVVREFGPDLEVDLTGRNRWKPNANGYDMEDIAKINK